MNKKNEIKLGAILSYLQMALNVIIGLLYTPAMIRLLGKSEYGLYNTITSTISMLSILSLGFNSSYIRYFAKYKEKQDTNAIYKLNGLFFLVFVVIGLVVLVCGLFLTFNLNLIFADGLTLHEYKTAKVLMILATVNLSISFPASVFGNIISAYEKFVFYKSIGMIRTVVKPLVTLPILLMGYRSIAMMVVGLLIGILVDFIYLVYIKAVLKNKFIFHGFEKGLFKSLLIYTSFIAINTIVNEINNSIDKVILARFRGTEEVAICAVAYTIYQYYMMFSTAISGVFTPRIHTVINETKSDLLLQKERLTGIFIRVGRVQFLILALISSGFLFFGKSFIYYWAGEGYEEAYYVILILMFAVTVPLIQNIGIEVQRAQNQHQFRSIVYLIIAIMNLVVSIFLARKYGVIGCAIGTAASLVIGNGIIMNIYYHKKCRIDILSFWKNIVRLLIGLSIPVCVGVLILLFVNLYNIWIMLLSILLYMVVYCVSMWFLGMNREEKLLAANFFAKILKRK